MSETAAVMAVIQSAKAAGDILSGLIRMRISAGVLSKIVEANKLLIEMQSQVMAVQSENAALIARIREFEEQAVQSKRKQGALENYQMAQVSAGAFVYAMKPDAQSAEPAHWLCPNCFGNGHRSILQYDATFSVGGHDLFTCLRCKSDVEVAKGVRP